MPKYSVSKTFHWQGQISDKAAQVCRTFGLTADRLTERTVTHTCQVEINDGDIVYITGPSGSGKTILLNELAESVPASERVCLGEIELTAGKTLIDCIDGNLYTSLSLLSTAGLSDVFCMLSQPTELSDGQKYRFRLAVALATGKKFIFADEFCSNLDRISAATISYNVHKFAKRNGVTFVLASSHDDILLDLAPDVLITKELCGPTQVIYKRKRGL
jgi:hypothetical protein